jgi:hypothetical protein
MQRATEAEWLGVGVQAVAMHFLLTDMSPSYRALLKRLRAWWERLTAVRPHLTGRLLKDVREAANGG